ncbi:hypothetical protein Bca101_067466 [Brassica carinata]
MKQGDSSVREYNSSFLAAGLLDNHDQGMLVKMYRDGLKEDIRVALGLTEFSTIDDIMQAALDIEEDSSNESDESEKRPKKKPRTEMQPEDEQPHEEPYGDKNTSKMKQGDSSVREYNTLFLAAGLFDNHDQGIFLFFVWFLRCDPDSNMVQDTSQGSMTVTQYRSFFYNLEIVQRLDEQALISVAKAGLKEEIRQGLDGNIFPTLEALFEEATEVEEILKTRRRNSPRKRRRNSPDHGKRARKAAKKGDPEDEGYDYVPPPNPDSENEEDQKSDDEDLSLDESASDESASDEDVNSTSGSDA